MHKVNRPVQPKILADNSEQWTLELMEQLMIYKYSDVSDKYKNRYNHPEIRKALKIMYNGCCCYCEGAVALVSYGAIEHFKPKSVFPELSFSWDNLHYCCEICNTSYKKTQWNENLLDPSKDEISEHLVFNLQTGEYDDLDEKGKETIRITGINREGLVERRLKEIAKLSQLCRSMKKEDLLLYFELLMKDQHSYITLFKTFYEMIISL